MQQKVRPDPDETAWRIWSLAGLYSDGHLPRAGGALRQDATLIACIRTVIASPRWRAAIRRAADG